MAESTPLPRVTSAAAPAPLPLVVKIGGGLLAASGADDVRAFAAALADAATTRPVAIVPGGPFADAVREADRTVGLSDDAADRLAILAMDQFGHLLLDLPPDASATTSLDPVGWDAGRLTVLLPAARLLAERPLPASWDATSDSLVVWIAATAGARLLLAKPVAGLRSDWPSETSLSPPTPSPPSRLPASPASSTPGSPPPCAASRSTPRSPTAATPPPLPRQFRF